MVKTIFFPKFIPARAQRLTDYAGPQFRHSIKSMCVCVRSSRHVIFKQNLTVATEVLCLPFSHAPSQPPVPFTAK